MMRWESYLVGSFVGLILASLGEAQPIEIRPKKPATESPATPAPRPAPRIPRGRGAVDAPAALNVNTIVEIEILSEDQGGDPNAQKWGKVFEQLGAAVRVRFSGDVKPGVTEKVRGPLRYVTAVGLLGRGSELSFGATSFRLSETERVKEWLDEIKVYGAQGAPAGQPLWGLSRIQFAEVNDRMAKPLVAEAKGQSVKTLVKSLQNEDKLPVHLTSVTESWLGDAAHDRTISVSVAGFSTGTGLAIALNDIDLGLRPVRTPAGKIEYEILPLDRLSDPWPMGWEPDPATPRDQITPELFKKGVVGFEKSPLTEVLAAIETETGTPIIIDMRKSLARKIDVKSLKVSSPAKKTAWALVISACVRPSGLYNHYRQDEAGRGFMLIAPFEAKAVVPE